MSSKMTTLMLTMVRMKNVMVITLRDTTSTIYLRVVTKLSTMSSMVKVTLATPLSTPTISRALSLTSPARFTIKPNIKRKTTYLQPIKETKTNELKYKSIFY